MELLKKLDKFNQLYIVYGPLLTKRQRQYFELYYFDNYSLQEVADFLEVSKNAVFDQLSKVEKKLEDYESKINIVKTNLIKTKLLDTYIKTKEIKYLEKLRKMDE